MGHSLFLYPLFPRHNKPPASGFPKEKAGVRGQCRTPVLRKGHTVSPGRSAVSIAPQGLGPATSSSDYLSFTPSALSQLGVRRCHTTLFLVPAGCLLGAASICSSEPFTNANEWESFLPVTEQEEVLHPPRLCCSQGKLRHGVRFWRCDPGTPPENLKFSTSFGGSAFRL